MRAITNKRALGPWVAHLRMMTVYKGKEEHSSYQSTALNYDRSAISLRLDKINRM